MLKGKVKFMPRAFAKFFLVLFLLQNTIAGEVLKLPLLFEHYAQHKALYPHTTIGGFLKMHYIDKTVIDADYAQDMQLPFKTIDNHNLQIQLSLPPTFQSVSNAPTVFIKSILPYQNPPLPAVLTSPLLRPPQIMCA